MTSEKIVYDLVDNKYSYIDAKILWLFALGMQYFN